MTILISLETTLLVLLVLLVVGVLRSHAEILRTLHASEHERVDQGVPQAGTESLVSAATDIVGVTTTGDDVRVEVGDGRRATMLAFLTSGCLTCLHFWETLGHGVSLPEDANVVIVTRGPDEEVVTKVRELAQPGRAVVMSSKAWRDYGVPGAPYFIWANAEGVIKGVGTGSSWPSVEKLLSDSLQEAAGLAGERERENTLLVGAGIGPGHPSLADPVRVGADEA